MSIDQFTGRVQSLGNMVSSGLNVTNRLAADLGVAGADATYWIDKLRPASFRGVQFGVMEGQLRFGRRVAIHEYPFRDTVWVEDLGKSARRVAFNGFLVGDDCIAQRDRLIKACEDVGAVEGGDLVHPTLGRMTVSLAEAVSCVERWDRGRVFEIGFSFIEQGRRIFPSSAADTGDAVASAVNAAQAVTSADFLATVAGALKAGMAVASQAVSGAASWAASAQRLVNDATNLYHFVQNLPGAFARPFGGRSAQPKVNGSTVQSLVALGAAGRARVATAGADLARAAAGLVPVAGGVASGAGSGGGAAPGGVQASVAAALDDYSAAAHSLAGAVGSAAPSPPDAMRLLSGLVSAAPAFPGNLAAPTYPITPVVPTPSTQALSLMASASSDLFRRAAVIALARASASYQPGSYDDAAGVRALVIQLLDHEIVVAADQGQDATYNALRNLRAAVVRDLAARGTNLATMVTVTTPMTVPALVLAQRLYRDAARAVELVDEANPIHPAFMPVAFKALAT